MLETIMNNDAHIGKVSVDIDNIVIEVKTWDQKTIMINCKDFYGIKNYTWIGEDIGNIIFSRDSTFFNEVICAQFNSNREKVPFEVRSMKICSAWDDSIILEVIASDFIEGKATDIQT